MLRKDPFVTGEYYHIYNRGVDKRIIFKLNKDYERFMILLHLANSDESFSIDELMNRQALKFSEILSIPIDRTLVSIGSWSLMPNHFHLLLKQEIDGGITKFMRKIGTGYSMYFNIKYQRKGALFGGLFKSKLVADDNYLRHLFGYINLNALELEFPDWEKNISKPIDKMKKYLDSNRYSSYLDFSGKDRVEKKIINPENFPDYFGGNQTFDGFIKDYFSNVS